METAMKVPLSERINLRMLTFFGVIGFIVAYIMFIYVRAEITGGVMDAGGGYKLVDLKAMSNFQFDQYGGTTEQIPATWRQLDGQKVILEGEMWNTQTAGPRVESFELCYSIAKCCFSGEPLIQHFVKANVPEGRQVLYYNTQVRVKGTLHVKAVMGPEKVESVFQLDVESVERVR